MMENENMTTEIIEEVVETGMVEEVAKSTSGKDVGLGMLIGGAATVAAIAIVKGVKKGIATLKAKKKAKTITRPIGHDKDDDITKDDLDIEDIEP